MKPHLASYGVLRRGLLSLAGAAIALCSAAIPAAERLVVGINDGVIADARVFEVEKRFKPQFDAISKRLGREPVYLVSSNFEQLRGELKMRRFDLAFVRPGHIAAQAVKDWGYVPVVSSKAGAITFFVAKRGRGMANLSDLRGKKLIMAEPQSLSARVAMLELKRNGIEPTQIKIDNTRLQEVVVYSLREGLRDAGVINDRAALKKWLEEEGGVLLHSSVPAPTAVLLIKAERQADQTAVLEVLQTLSQGPDAATVLQPYGPQGYKPQTREELLGFLAEISA
jgi:ABC-type phosphate/phosphonate transport system substrate-binding protein